MHQILMSLLNCHAFSICVANKFDNGRILKLLLTAITQLDCCSIWLAVKSGTTFSTNEIEKKRFDKMDDLSACFFFFFCFRAL